MTSFSPVRPWGYRRSPPSSEPYAEKLTAMVESGVYGRGYAKNIYVAAGGGCQTALPLGGLPNVRKLYVYLNSDAVLIINGCRLPMQVTRQGYWELSADMLVISLALLTDGQAASGKYCVFGAP